MRISMHRYTSIKSLIPYSVFDVRRSLQTVSQTFHEPLRRARRIAGIEKADKQRVFWRADDRAGRDGGGGNRVPSPMPSALRGAKTLILPCFFA